MPTPKAPAASSRLDDAGALLCLKTFLGEMDWTTGVTALVTQLNKMLGCHRVSLGWVVGQSLQVRALSDGVLLDEGIAMPEVHQAMLEASHQQAVLFWPPRAAAQDASQHRITLAHQTLYRVQGLSGLVTVPLAQDDAVIGALTFERTGRNDPLRPVTPQDQREVHAGFADDELRWLEQVASVLAPALALRYKLEQPWWERMRAWAESLKRRLSDPRERVLRWSVLAFFGVVSFGIGLPLPYQLTATARLEGAVQRVMSAPQDGFLREVNVRPGDVVKAGQVMADMSDDELQGTRRARQAEANQHENAFAEAFARGDRAQAVIAQSKLAQAKAELSLIEQQIARLKITAPFDGVVIAGDLRQQLGAPVKRGDALLTLAPGLDWRVVMEVDEADVASLSKGQLAQLRLAAMPDQTIGLVLSRVTPVAKSTASGLKYEIEAVPSGAGAGATGLRPGLQGVARIDMPSRPLLWRAADRCWHWLRMQAWIWL
ncbi:MAG: HlyD family efflux transporter periplasmic adaptor subunit [Aquabacterium sp.]